MKGYSVSSLLALYMQRKEGYSVSTYPALQKPSLQHDGVGVQENIAAKEKPVKWVLQNPEIWLLRYQVDTVAKFVRMHCTGQMFSFKMYQYSYNFVFTLAHTCTQLL